MRSSLHPNQSQSISPTCSTSRFVAPSQSISINLAHLLDVAVRREALGHGADRHLAAQRPVLQRGGELAHLPKLRIGAIQDHHEG